MLGDGIGSNVRKSKLINRRMFLASAAKAVVFFGIVSSVGQLDSKIDDGFKDVLSKISDAHPHSALADRYRKRTAKEAKGKAALDRIKKKYGKITE